MRKVLVMMLVVCTMLCCITEAIITEARIIDEEIDDEPIIESFPAYGICTGDYVRYRSGPGINYRILGRLFDGDEVTVRSSRWVNGDLWYQIDNPNGRGRAWVSGSYIEPLHPNGG